MRAFFCFFFALFWVLCAQEKPELTDVEKFKADYGLMKKEIGEAKDRTISVDFSWVETHTQYLMKMVGNREVLLGSVESAVVREEIRSMDLQPLIDAIMLVGKRMLIERNVQVWSLDDISPQLTLLSQELNRFEQARGGFTGLHELYRPSKISWDLEIIGQVLAHTEFVSRVCKDVEGCVDNIAVLQKKVIADQARAKLWMEKIKTLQSPVVVPPLPENQSKKPG